MRFRNANSSNLPIFISWIYRFEKTSVTFAGMDYLTDDVVDKKIFKLNVEVISKPNDEKKFSDN